ncbi:hypothetical protein TNCV_3145941 [Trichonephila clavipes]|nr:hypothetical protein TNCV_3145941 [Trichonephila clavipes]
MLKEVQSNTPNLSDRWPCKSNSPTQGLLVTDHVILNHGQVTQSYCKEQLPAPGNRSNERRDREKDLATTGAKKGRNGREERVAKKNRGREK